MKIHIRKVITAMGCAIAAASMGQSNLVVNGDFQTSASGDGWPDGWRRTPGFTAESDTSGNVWLSTTNSYVGLSFAIPMGKDYERLRFSARLRATDVVLGRERWQDGRIALDFRDAQGERVGGFPRSPSLKGTTDWVDFDYSLDVPDGAAYLHASLVLFGPSGKIEFDDIAVSVEHRRKSRTPDDPSGTVRRRPRVPVGTELLVNGAFESGSDGWEERRFPPLILSDGMQAAVLTTNEKRLNQIIEIPEGAARIQLSLKGRAEGIVPGKEGWHDGRLAMMFADASGEQAGPWPDVFRLSGTTDWINFERTYEVPREASTLRIGGYMQGLAGTLYLGNLSIRVAELFATPEDAPCPVDAAHVWDATDAWAMETPTRSKRCLNGYWRFFPVFDDGVDLPAEGAGWGWFKVPGIWPIPNEPSAQEPVLPVFQQQRGDMTTLREAWYSRWVEIPETLSQRRMIVDFEWVQAQASVFLNGMHAGEINFPGGTLDITDHVLFGTDNRLDVRVSARPQKPETTVAMDAGTLFKTETILKLKGITGDVYLTAIPKAVAVDDIRFTADGFAMTLDTEVSFLGAPPQGASIQVTFFDNDQPAHHTEPVPLHVDDSGYAHVRTVWPDVKRWDVDTPENIYTGVVVVRDAAGVVIDRSFPIRFGFRDFRISGRHFLLNGTPVRWRSLLADNINGQADVACAAGSMLTMTAIKTYGFNSAITHNYHFRAGGVGYSKAFLDAADAKGVMIAFSMPHGSDFDWLTDDPATLRQYERISRYLVRKVWNHPSVMLYTMNHNQCGYAGDLNPLAMDGIQSPEHGRPVNPNATREKAKHFEHIVKSIDPTRPVYHHSSGNLGDIYSNNIYLNWAPVQERDEWIAFWAANGTKPLFFVEWGLPHIASWSSYRGPAFIWRTRAYQSIWDSEFAATLLGADAYRMTAAKEKQLALEEDLWSREQAPHWGHLCQPLRENKALYHRITDRFLQSNWRNFRAWGLTAILPWDQELIAERKIQSIQPEPNPARHAKLKHPGIVPDVFLPPKSFIHARNPVHFETTAIGARFKNLNKPILAWIAGKPEAFTEQAANFKPGDPVFKQLAFVSDARKPVLVTYRWRVEALGVEKTGHLELAPGTTTFVPIQFTIPESPTIERAAIEAEFNLGGMSSRDHFALTITTPPAGSPPATRIALFDPIGDTARELDRMAVRYSLIAEHAPMDDYDLLVIGRNALTGNPERLGIERVREGLNVLIFEQASDVLQNRFGFRMNEQGLRRVFILDPHAAAIQGLNPDLLCDWQGESTTLPPYIAGNELGTPTWNWAGFSNTRVWRNRNRGNVAHALIELPSVGNFTAILGGGFDLQYATLMEYREGAGAVLFCQTEVTGRTETDPAAERLMHAILNAAATPRDGSTKPVYRLPGNRVEKLLRDLRIAAEPYDGHQSLNNAILVVGPESTVDASLMDTIFTGASVIGLNLDGDQLSTLSNGRVRGRRGREWSGLIEDTSDALFRGIPVSDFHVRTRRLDYVMLDEGLTDGNRAFQIIRHGKGVLVLSQIAPWNLDHTVDNKGYLRTSYRRNLHLTSQLLRNLGASASCDLLQRLAIGSPPSRVPLPEIWKGMADPEAIGMDEAWMDPAFDDTAWREFTVPGAFDDQYPDLNNYLGYFWYRLRFDKPPPMTSETVTLYIGPVDDESVIWLNGRLLGSVNTETHPTDYWLFPRQYEVKRSELREKDNVLVVQVNDTYLKGGIMGTPAFKTPGPWLNSFYLQTPEAGDDPYRYYRW